MSSSFLLHFTFVFSSSSHGKRQSNHVEFALAIRHDSGSDEEVSLPSHHRCHAGRSSHDRRQRSPVGSDQNRSHSRLSLGRFTSHLPLISHHSRLQTPDLVHNVLSGTQYRCEYRRADRSTMFQRNIRFHVEICTVKSMDTSVPDSYYVTFTLITGRTSSTSDLYPSSSSLRSSETLQEVVRRNSNALPGK